MTGNLLLDFVIIALKAIFTVIIVIGMAPVLIVLERKISAFIQDRPGPNRAHIGGIRLGGFVFVLADAIKLFTKESFTPATANRFFYNLGPAIAVMVALSTGAVIPFADNVLFHGHTIPMSVLPINAGLLWFFAISSLGVFGIIFGGWASNNKYSLLGAIRSTAQIISYEIPLGLSAIGILMLFGTLELNKIVAAQAGVVTFFGLFPLGVKVGPAWLGLPNWGIFLQPLSFIIFLVASYAETNRTPFDLAESESELVAGFHTEYGGMKFGMYFFAEYMAMVVASSIMVTLFLGGYQVPFLDTAALQQLSLPLIRIVLACGVVLLALMTVGLFKFYQSSKGRWGDARDREGAVLGSITLAATAITLALLIAALGVSSIPNWGHVAFAAIAQFGAFFIKMFFLVTSFIWVRWTVPRFRYDQLMELGWKSLLPLSLANIAVTGSILLLIQHFKG